jgi:hypothetical protein
MTQKWEPQVLRDFESGLTRGEMENSSQNLDIRKSNGHDVKAQYRNGSQAIDDIDPDAAQARQARSI